MKNFSLKALGAFIFAAGLVVAGVAAPAQAATMNGTAVASGGGIAATGTNAYPVTVSFTPVTAGSDEIVIVFPTGWTRVNSDGTAFCTSLTKTSAGTSVNCSSPSTSRIRLFRGGGVTFVTSGPVTVEFPAGSLNVNSNRDFQLTASGMINSTPTTQDSGVATLASAPASYTVTFDANGGSGTTPAQTASSTTALTSNAFTRTGYTFAGWNSAADGSGLAIADGANYSFSSSRTFYAQWTASGSGGGSGSGSGAGSSSSESLANTGVNSASGISLLAGGLSLALVGAEMFMIARRKRSN